ncbi:MAG: hypothetical protein HWD85_00415 [Flavobacteriaceae bacterium]|nr:hypothetical protein [Flavobacteriaceae bacterium]
MKKTLFLFLLSLILVSCVKDELLPLQIENLTSNYVNAGDEISFIGGNIYKNVTASLNGEPITIVLAEKNKLTLKIPENATSGILKLSFVEPEVSEFEQYIKINDIGWEEIDILQYFSNIQFVEENIAYAAVIVPDGESEIYKTVDGGISWTLIYETYRHIFSFKALNKDVVYTKGISNYNTSTNGGATWSEIKTPEFRFRYLPYSFVYFNTNEVLLLANKGGEGHVIKSIDGGKTWIEKNKFPSNTGEYRNAEYMRIVYEEGNTVCVFDLKYKKITKSFDKGETWTESQLNYNAGKPLQLVPLTFDFLDDQNIWFYDKEANELYKSTDGGVSTTKVMLPDLSDVDEKIRKIKIVDANNIFMLTDHDGTLYTNDGGLNWKLYYHEHVPGYPSIFTVATFNRNVYLTKDGKMLKKKAF